jgi:hypothetical protein
MAVLGAAWSCSVDANVGRIPGGADASPGDDGSLADAPATADAAADGADAGTDASGPLIDGGCGVVVAQQGGWVGVEIVSGSPPQPSGGAIAIGTYKLTALRAYGGTGGNDEERETLVVTGSSTMGTFSSLDEARNTSGPFVSHGPQGTTSQWQATSSTMTVFIDGTCPTSAVSGGQYTATPTTLLLMQIGSPPLDREYALVP